MNKSSLGLTVVALSAVATIGAVSQEDIATLRACVDMAEYTELEAPAAMPQRVEGLSGQTRAFNVPSMEQFEQHLALLEREYALEQEELRSIKLEEVAAQEAAEIVAAEQEVALTRQIELNELLEEQMAAEVVLATQTRDMLESAGIQVDTTVDEPAGILRTLRNRIAALFS